MANQTQSDPLVRANPLHPLLYESIVRRALKEDLGRAGDLTTDAVVPADRRGTGRCLARQSGCVAGIEVALFAFRTIDPEVDVERPHRDGDPVVAGETLVVVHGSTRSVLTAERVALNFLARLSGIATATAEMVAAVQGYPAKVSCTRKTTPGLRALEKYAVRVGGGVNHRFGLDDAVLIKDNHIRAAGSITEAVRRVRAAVGHMVKVQVEVDDLEQLEEAIGCPIDAVLLDNMSPEMLRRAVDRVGGRLVTEASGNIRMSNAREVAATGVDLLSAGWLTHSAPALDVSLELDPHR